jgi:hypothetical protein
LICSQAKGFPGFIKIRKLKILMRKKDKSKTAKLSGMDAFNAAAKAQILKF